MNNDLFCLFLKMDLTPGCSIATLNERYRMLASLFHPDQITGEKRKEIAEREMIALNDRRDRILAHLKGATHRLVGDCDCRRRFQNNQAMNSQSSQSSQSSQDAREPQKKPEAKQTPPPQGSGFGSGAQSTTSKNNAHTSSQRAANSAANSSATQDPPKNDGIGPNGENQNTGGTTYNANEHNATPKKRAQRSGNPNPSTASSHAHAGTIDKDRFVFDSSRGIFAMLLICLTLAVLSGFKYMEDCHYHCFAGVEGCIQGISATA
jgi:cobalamin biosynthesis Mg chelatase CobN